MTWAILLLCLGLALIVAEVLFPSFGVLSVLAALSILGAIVIAFRHDAGVPFLLATAVGVPGALLVGLKLFPKSPVGKKFVASGLSFGSEAATDARDLGLVGERGVVLQQLRPAGTARIGDRRVDVVSRGEFIAAGEAVEVLEVNGNRVVVRPVEEEVREAEREA